MKLQAGGVVLVEVEVRAQRPRLVPRPVPAAHHVVRPLDPPGLGVEPLDVRLHLRPELAHVGALVVDAPRPAVPRGLGGDSIDFFSPKNGPENGPNVKFARNLFYWKEFNDLPFLALWTSKTEKIPYLPLFQLLCASFR